MTKELPKIYEPSGLERSVAEKWISGGYFAANADPGDTRQTYTIVIPPPNVTAALHLGHALNNTLQDILIRYHRMCNRNTLWMPGTDHAGIATQTVVEKNLLAEQGRRRTDFQRDQFIAHVQAWKDQYEARIIEQLKKMGCSCDWDRTRFTMDDTCAAAVREAFFKLFSDGLIYRGKRLVNWDPATQTVLADDEVEYQTVAGYFWYLRYPLVKPIDADGKKIEYVTVATTRPETMLGDTAVAINPADPLAKYLEGKEVLLPIVARKIPIITDDHVVLPDPQSENEKARFSTGFLKVTPAHDPDDWQIGQRHRLPVVNIFAPDGSISDKHGFDDWRCIKDSEIEKIGILGMDRFKARELIVDWFRKRGLLEDTRPYTHDIGHSYRSHVPIEPYLSDQWYIAVKKPIGHPARTFGTGLIDGTDVPVNSLAGLALKPLLDGKLRFIPQRYAKTYQAWLENLRDWPISRQLWWGHQIPVWHKQGEHPNRPEYGTVRQLVQTENGPVTFLCVKASFDRLEQAMTQEGWIRDEDVLDTWFSSALWPFSTMGWPKQTDELKKFYPTNVLCTAREIITLWVSRMVMMGQYCVGQIPFSDVYIHSMIQDGLGRKMSKSLGNGIDPLVIIDSHGADAMRFTLAGMTTDTQDIRLPVISMKLPDGREANTSPKFDTGRSFCNKLWNASRFAMMNLEGTDPAAFDPARLDITDRWILSRLASTASLVTKLLDEYKFNEPVNELYKFFWNDFCDWYLEWIKPRMQQEHQKPIAQNVLAFVLDRTLRLLHPFVPFITEGIFQNLNQLCPSRELKGLLDPCADLSSAQTAVLPDALIIASWPLGLESLVDKDCQQRIELVQNVIRPIRDIRSKYNINPGIRLGASASGSRSDCLLLNENAAMICHLAGLKSFEAKQGLAKPATAAAGLAGSLSVYLHDVIDPQAEKKRLEKQLEQIETAINPIQAKLANENFTNRAKPEVVDQARRKLAELTEQLQTVRKHLDQLDNP